MLEAMVTTWGDPMSLGSSCKALSTKPFPKTLGKTRSVPTPALSHLPLIQALLQSCLPVPPSVLPLLGVSLGLTA